MSPPPASPQPTPPPPSPTTSVLPQEMGLDEVMRVMDVASTLRKEQELVEREFNLDKTKQQLRDKLIRTAEMTGESLTPEQVEAAVDWYYDNLHQYAEPEKNWRWYLAHLYIRRGLVAGIAIPIMLFFATIWSLWFAPFAPFSKTNRQQHALNAAHSKIEKSIRSINAVAKTDRVKKLVADFKNESRSHFQNGDLQRLQQVQTELNTIDSEINQQYTITVVSGENQRSGIDRYQPNGKFSGYYLIVQARTDDGKILKQQIKNSETDKYETVDIWGEKVPKSVYDRLLNDKKADGILNETVFANKKRGELKINMIMPGESNLPLERSTQITDW